MKESAESLRGRKCAPCEGGAAALGPERIAPLLASLEGWSIEDGALTKTFSFRNYHETLAFVNATAWISHREDHHPDIRVGYNQCTVAYVTHAINGLSDNDFICAAKIDALWEL